MNLNNKFNKIIKFKTFLKFIFMKIEFILKKHSF